jgi:hypothetical protein
MIESAFRLASLVRKSPDAIKYHLYGNKSYYDHDKVSKKFTYRVVKVDSNYNFTVTSPEYFTDNLNNSFSIKYRECPADTAPEDHYLMGDIVVKKDFNKNKYSFFGSNFIISDDTNSFLKADELFPTVDNLYVKNFREAFRKQTSIITDLILEWENSPECSDKKNGLYVYFEFDESFNVTQWYQLDGVIEYLDKIKMQSMCSGMFDVTSQGYVLNKSFIHTLCSGDEKNDEQSPSFQGDNRYKNFTILKEDAYNIFYIKGVLDSCSISIPKNDTNRVRVLPCGDFSYNEFKGFIDTLPKYMPDNTGDEEKAEEAIQEVVYTDIFDAFDPPSSNIVSFDITFYMKSSYTNVDMIEISSLSRSYLRKVIAKIKAAQVQVYSNPKYRPFVWKAFYELLSIPNAKNQPKYKSHIIKVLPKIMKGAYHQDSVLLKELVQKTQLLVRNNTDDQSMSNIFNNLYRCFTFATLIQSKGSLYMNTLENVSESAELGKMMAKISFPLTVVISSFLKRNVGFLSRRAGTLKGAESLLAEWATTVARHEKECNKDLNIEVSLNTYAVKEAGMLLDNLKEKGNYDVNEFVVGYMREYSSKSYANNKSVQSNN